MQALFTRIKYANHTNYRLGTWVFRTDLGGS
jgi:hypothetical protein